MKCLFDKDLFLSLCDKYNVKFSETANKPIICENRNRIVQHIKMDMPGFPKQGLYCYGEASFEANQAMQEPLEKLYKYENQPDMREKVKEYIGELDAEYDRCMNWIEEHMNGDACQVTAMEMRAKTLMEVKNDLQGRLEELV